MSGRSGAGPALLRRVCCSGSSSDEVRRLCSADVAPVHRSTSAPDAVAAVRPPVPAARQPHDPPPARQPGPEPQPGRRPLPKTKPLEPLRSYPLPLPEVSRREAAGRSAIPGDPSSRPDSFAAAAASSAERGGQAGAACGSGQAAPAPARASLAERQIAANVGPPRGRHAAAAFREDDHGGSAEGAHRYGVSSCLQNLDSTPRVR